MRRACPDCFADSPRVLASIDAGRVVAGNATYRRDALAILGLGADARFELASCARCGFVYALDAPDAAFLTRVYEQAIDGDAAREIARSPGWVAHQLEVAVGLLQRCAARDEVRFLDYGCGEGTVVRALDGPKVHATGFDPHAASPRTLRSFDEVRAIAPFDAVLLSDVLEHVPEPRALLARCRELLDDGGWLAVSVPDFSPGRLRAVLDDLRAQRAVTPELNPWEHLNYFSPAALARMVASEGFDVDVQPAPHFGFRSSTRGVRGAGNALRSAGRMLRHALRPTQGSTTLFARRA